jgi:GntR family transcriptional regulator
VDGVALVALGWRGCLVELCEAGCVLAGGVDLSGDRAVYKQIADVLRSRMTSGELGPGARLPSEHELVEAYGVARGTARQAIVQLRSEGLIESVHGVGSFVRAREPAVVLRTDRPGRGLQLVPDPDDDPRSDRDRAAGGAVSEESVRIATTWVGRVTVDEHNMDDELYQAAKELGMRFGGSVLVRHWRELVGDRVQALMASYVAWETAQHAGLEHVSTGPEIYDALTSTGYRLTSYTEQVQARMPTVGEARTLAIGPGVPVMAVLRVSYLADEIPLEVRSSVMSGDRHRLLYEVKDPQ